MKKQVIRSYIKRALSIGLSAMMLAGGIGELGVTTALAAPAAAVAESKGKVASAAAEEGYKAATTENGNQAATNTAALNAQYTAARQELQSLAADNYIIAAINLISDYQPLTELIDITGKKVVASPMEATTGTTTDATNTASAGTLSSGKTVFITDLVLTGSYENPTYYVAVTYSSNDANDVNDAITTGFVPFAYVASSDSRYLSWQQTYGIYENLPFGTSKEDADAYTDLVGDTEKTAKDYADIAQFPESYQAALLALKQEHPTWTFVRQDTKLDWSAAVTAEASEARSLLYYTLPDYMREMAYDDSGYWYYASKDSVAYYLDPRTYISESGIFAFELMTYNETLHTSDALEKLFDGTFMDDANGTMPGYVLTYAFFLTAIGKELKVSPFYLGARILQEQGTKGTSSMISGTYKGYEGYYNYFNIGATGEAGKDNNIAITNGLTYAKNAGWDNRYDALYGGSKVFSEKYILKGQDTLYLQKFNVNPDSSYATYTHQYMQNLTAPTTEGATMKKLYTNAEAMESAFVFKIPVYEAMTATATEYPKDGDSVSITIPKGYAVELVVGDKTVETEARNGYYSVKMNGAAKKILSVVKRDEKGDITDFYVWKAEKNDAGTYVVTDLSADSVKEKDRYTGWVMSPSVTVVKETDDEIVTTVKKGKWHYLKNGKIATGWQKVDKKWYYLNANGELQEKGWLELDNTWYYIQADTSMATGWMKKGNKWYYFGDDGAMRTGWEKVGKDYYYFNEDGVMQTGWVEVSGKWYYLNSNGKMATEWLQRGKKWYYMGKSGAMSTGFATIKNSTYYFDENGVMQTGWVQVLDKWYYLNTNGKLATGWLKRGDKHYYMDEAGAMQIGWCKVDGKWYYFNNSGVMQSGWQQIDDAWYYFQSNGSMTKGWLQRGSKWYYFDKNGAMVTGTRTIDGKEYTFDEGGVMQAK